MLLLSFCFLIEKGIANYPIILIIKINNFGTLQLTFGTCAYDSIYIVYVIFSSISFQVTYKQSNKHKVLVVTPFAGQPVPLIGRSGSTLVVGNLKIVPPIPITVVIVTVRFFSILRLTRIDGDLFDIYDVIIST